MKKLFIPALLLMLAACGKSEQAPASVQTAAMPAVAASPAIQKIYDTTCKTCHANPASGAPQAGDTQAWSKRVAQGKDTLLDHTIAGFQKMPPMGLCTQCSEADFTALIGFMSGSTLK